MTLNLHLAHRHLAARIVNVVNLIYKQCVVVSKTLRGHHQIVARNVLSIANVLAIKHV